MKQCVYQAGPLFSDADRAWHRRLSSIVRQAGHSVIWPGDLLTDQEIQDAGDKAVSLIFSSCKEAIERCSCVVALLDGAQVDDGTAWEIGFAHARGVPVIGVRTDSRSSGDTRYNVCNSMIEGCLFGLARTEQVVLDMLEALESGTPNTHSFPA